MADDQAMSGNSEVFQFDANNASGAIEGAQNQHQEDLMVVPDLTGDSLLDFSNFNSPANKKQPVGVFNVATKQLATTLNLAAD